jgi:hypothetical protein
VAITFFLISNKKNNLILHLKNSLTVKVSFILFFILLFLNSNHSHAQLAGSQLMREIQYSQKPGKVTIVQDSNIPKLIDKHLYEESKRKGIAGYRIRIYSNSGKQAYTEGPKVEAEFISKYEGIKTHYIFDSPFHLIYVGDFRTHSDAIKFLKTIEGQYPDAFIVHTRIDYPAL